MAITRDNILKVMQERKDQFLRDSKASYDRLIDSATRPLEQLKYRSKVKALAKKWANSSLNHPGSVESAFLREIKKGLEGLLQSICLTSKSKEEQSLRCARVAGNIETIDILMKEPKKAIDLWEGMNPDRKETK